MDNANSMGFKLRIKWHLSWVVAFISEHFYFNFTSKLILDNLHYIDCISSRGSTVSCNTWNYLFFQHRDITIQQGGGGIISYIVVFITDTSSQIFLSTWLCYLNSSYVWLDSKKEFFIVQHSEKLTNHLDCMVCW